MTLDDWVTHGLVLTGCFLVASLAVGLHYCAFSFRNAIWDSIAILLGFSGVCCTLFLLSQMSMMREGNVLGAGFAILVSVSAIQTFPERSLRSDSPSWLEVFWPLLLGNGCMAFNALCGLIPLYIVFFMFLSSPRSLLWFGNWGYFAGLALAPLAISFFRLVFATVRLRPGVDRALLDEEMEEARGEGKTR